MIPLDRKSGKKLVCLLCLPDESAIDTRSQSSVNCDTKLLRVGLGSANAYSVMILMPGEGPLPSPVLVSELRTTLMTSPGNAYDLQAGLDYGIIGL
ncbi:hypothetical protein STEG23_024133 [Scotinomys teguina]